MIPAQAVEAALRALLPDTEPEALKGGFWWGNVETILEAAAPHMMAAAWKEGEAAGQDNAYAYQDGSAVKSNPYGTAK